MIDYFGLAVHAEAEGCVVRFTQDGTDCSFVACMGDPEQGRMAMVVAMRAEGAYVTEYETHGKVTLVREGKEFTLTTETK